MSEKNYSTFLIEDTIREKVKKKERKGRNVSMFLQENLVLVIVLAVFFAGLIFLLLRNNMKKKQKMEEFLDKLQVEREAEKLNKGRAPIEIQKQEQEEEKKEQEAYCTLKEIQGMSEEDQIYQLDTGKVMLKKEPILVCDIIDEAVRLQDAPVQVTEKLLQVSGNMEISVLGDLGWLAAAISNIIKNAMEYTKLNGTIKINYDEVQAEEENYIAITIEDTGKGMQSEDLVNVFKRYYKGSNAPADAKGLGLAIADKILSLQGGAIEIKSEYGKGTKVTVKLPMDV